LADQDDNILHLSNPITVTVGKEERTVSTLTFRAPKAKDLRVRDQAKGDVDATIRMIALLTNEPVQVIDELGASDFTAAAGKVAGFIETSPATGKT